MAEHIGLDVCRRVSGRSVTITDIRLVSTGSIDPKHASLWEISCADVTEKYSLHLTHPDLKPTDYLHLTANLQKHPHRTDQSIPQSTLRRFGIDYLTAFRVPQSEIAHLCIKREQFAIGIYGWRFQRDTENKPDTNPRFRMVVSDETGEVIRFFYLP